VAIVAVAFIIGGIASAEEGWPMNEAGEPGNGGNWQGTGQLDIEPEGIFADWYNTTNESTSWIVEDGDDILRSFSAFDYVYDLTIQDGGILHLDSVDFRVNSTDENHTVVIEAGGKLNITNSSFSGWKILVQPGGELYIHPGNGSSAVSIDKPDAPGIIVSSGSVFESINASISGASTLVTIEDTDPVINGTMFSTYGDDKPCILLKAAADIHGNKFMEMAQKGSYAIIAEEGIDSKIYDNEFEGFKYGFNINGRAIMSYGPLEIYDNLFTRMKMASPEGDPYVIYFVGVEPTDHDGQPVWETNRFNGKDSTNHNERVNMFKQAWNVEVTVTNNRTGNPIQDALVEIRDKDDYLWEDALTDAVGQAFFELAEFIVSANDDGPSGDSPKSTRDLYPYDIEASKEGQNDVKKGEDILMDSQFELGLDLMEFDYGVDNLELTPPDITAGDIINLKATVFNNGYNRETTVTVEFLIDDATRGEVKLGETDVLMDYEQNFASLDAQVPLSYANQDVIFKARTTFDPQKDGDTSNDEYVSDTVHINEKPTATITSPDAGETISGTINVTGTAGDNDGTVGEVAISITGYLNWILVEGTDSWYYELNTEGLGMANGDYIIEIRSKDNNNSYSDIASLTVTVMNTPTVTILSPGDGSLVLGNATAVTMVGATQKLEAAISNVAVSIDGGAELDAVKVVSDWSQWQMPLKTNDVDLINTLSDGSHTFTAHVYDEDGLTNTFSVTYTIYSMNETTNPVVVIETQPFTIIRDTMVEGYATDDFNVVDIKYRINDGDWDDATEIFNIDTRNTSWRIKIAINNKALDEGSNYLEVRAFDDDGNTTGALTIIKLQTGLVDLTITEVTLQNSDGKALGKDDLETGKFIKLIVDVGVDMVGSDPIPVSVQVQIGGTEAARLQKNVSSDFSLTFSITLKESMIGKKSYSVIVDPANIVPEDNADGNAEANNRDDGELPGTIEEGTSSNGDNGGLIPAFEIMTMVSALAIAVIVGLYRKRRD